MDSLPFQLSLQVGTELFPDAGQAPARMRTSVTGHSPDGSVPMPEVLAAANSVVSENSSAIRNYYLSQKQNSGLSGTGVYKHETTIPGGAVRYTNYYGSEELHVSVDAELVAQRVQRPSEVPEPEAPEFHEPEVPEVHEVPEPEVPEVPEPEVPGPEVPEPEVPEVPEPDKPVDPLSLMAVVLFKGNKLAAWAMRAVSKKQGFLGKPLIKRTLKSSDWASTDIWGAKTTTIRSTQLKLSSEFRPIVAAFKLEGSSIHASEGYTARDAQSFFTPGEPLKAGSSYFNGSRFGDPVMNGEKDKAYCCGNILTIRNGRVSVAPGDEIDWGPPSAITPQGGYYMGWGLGTEVTISTGVVPGVTIPDKSVTTNTRTGGPVILLGAPVIDTRSTTNAFTIEFFGPGKNYTSVSGGSILSVTTAALFWPPSSLVVTVEYTSDVDISLPGLPIMEFNLAGDKDDITIKPWDVKLKQHIYSYQETINKASVTSIYQHTTYTTLGPISVGDLNGVGETADVYQWPYWVTGKPYYLSFKSGKAVMHTPYGKLPVNLSTRGATFQGNCHCSNGGHVLQSFDISGRRYIYLDGSDIGAKLAAGLECEVEDIDCVFFDVSLGQVTLLT